MIKEANNNNHVWPLLSTPKQYNLHIKGRKDDEEGEKAYEDEEDKL